MTLPHRCVVAATLAAALSACVTPSHVHLEEPPPRSAPMGERVAYYEEHRPVSVRHGNGYPTMGADTTSASLTFLVLEDGTRIDDPNDLLPTVEPGSPTAHAASQVEDLETSATLWQAAMMIAVVGGTGVMLGSLMPLAFVSPADPNADAALPLSMGILLAGAGISLSSLLLLPVVGSASAAQQREKETAFMTYDRSLRERLDLVEYGQVTREARRLPPPEPDLEPR